MPAKRTGNMIFRKLRAKPQPMPRSMFNPAIAASMTPGKNREWWKKMSGVLSRSLIVYRSSVYTKWRDELGARVCQLAAQAKWFRVSAGPVGLRLTVHGTAWSGDGDKLLATVFDAVQIMSIGDDCQITDFDVRLRLDGKREIEIELYVPEDPFAAKWAEAGLTAQEQKKKARAVAALKRRARA